MQGNEEVPGSGASPLLLVATVGAAKPVCQAIAYASPDSVLLLGTERSWAQLESHSEAHSPGPAPNYLLHPDLEKITLAEESNFLALVEACRTKVTPFVAGWLTRHPGGRLIADFTGGTKPMTAALTLVARRWPAVRFQYIDGQRMASGPMLVLDGTEVAVYSPNPWDALGYQAAEDAITLFDGGSPAAAAVYLREPIRRASEDRPVRAALQHLEFLFQAYAAWDRFEHAEAARLFEIVRVDGGVLSPLFSEASRVTLWEQTGEHLRYLRAMRDAEGLTRELVLDLFANAVRRIHEQRFDDAVARLYRGCEAVAQLRLTQRYGWKDYRFAPVHIFPDGVPPAALRQGLRGDRVRLGGLQDLYLLLDSIGDPLGAAFRAAGLSAGGTSPLTARNRSILAHGLRPLHLSDARTLLDRLLPLAGVHLADLPLFPKLGGLS